MTGRAGLGSFLCQTDLCSNLRLFGDLYTHIHVHTHTLTHILPCMASTIQPSLTIGKLGESIELKEIDWVWRAIKFGFKSS